MTTSNKKKAIVASAILLLLTIGAGEIYNHERNLNDGNDKVAASENSNIPVTNVPVTASVDNAPAASAPSESEPLASTSVKYRRHHSKSDATTDGDQVSAVTTRRYEGHITSSTEPTLATAAVTTPKQTAVITRQKIKMTSNTIKSGTINFAPELGVNLNGMSRNSTSNIMTNGFHAGIMVNIALGNRFALQPGAMYIMKGNEDKSTATVEGTYVSTTHTITLNYLEIPVNIVYKFGDIMGAPRFMIGAGPYVSYLVNSKNRFESTSENAEGFAVGSNNYSTKSGIQNLDAGMGAFAGCQMPKGFYAKAGVEMGLTNIQPGTMDSKSSDRNYNFLLSVGYILGQKNQVY